MKPYRILDYRNEPKYVATYTGARRVAQKILQNDGRSSLRFVTIQQHEGENNWVDVESVYPHTVPTL